MELHECWCTKKVSITKCALHRSLVRQGTFLLLQNLLTATEDIHDSDRLPLRPKSSQALLTLTFSLCTHACFHTLESINKTLYHVFAKFEPTNVVDSDVNPSLLLREMRLFVSVCIFVLLCKPTETADWGCIWQSQFFLIWTELLWAENQHI